MQSLQFFPSSFQLAQHAPFETPKQYAWSPYENNGGTTIAVSGKDFVVVAADTRLSYGYSIHTRNARKLCQLTSQAVLATSGMQADQATLHKTLQTRMITYKQTHRKEMTVTALAQMLANTLYYKRFFPYYTFNVLAGVDAEGKGAVFNYDAVGSFERTPYSASGTGQSLLMPLLDNQIGKKNQQGAEFIDLSQEEVVRLVKDTLTSAGERDIYTGDFVDIAIITKEGITWEKFELKLD